MSISPDQMRLHKEQNNMTAINDIFYEAHFKYY